MGAVVDMALYNVGSMWLYPKLGVFEGGCPAALTCFWPKSHSLSLMRLQGPKQDRAAEQPASITPRYGYSRLEPYRTRPYKLHPPLID